MIKFLKKKKDKLKNIAILGAILIANVIAGAYSYKAYKKYSAPTVVLVDRAKEIKVFGQIRSLSPQMKQISKLVRDGEKEIFIQINSPGGRLDTTEKFLRIMNAAKYYDVEFTCVVKGRAASAATIILANCDNRYAVFGSGILWHSMLFQGMLKLNEASATEYLGFIQAKNEEIWADTRMYFYPWYFVEHFVKESNLLASEVEANSFGFLNVIRNLKYKKAKLIKKKGASVTKGIRLSADKKSKVKVKGKSKREGKKFRIKFKNPEFK